MKVVSSNLHILEIIVTVASLFQPAHTFLSTFLSHSLHQDTSAPLQAQRRLLLHSSSSPSSSLGKDADEDKMSENNNDNMASSFFYDDGCYDLCESFDNPEEENTSKGDISDGKSVGQSKTLPHFASMSPPATREKKEKSRTSSDKSNDEESARQMLNLRWSLMKSMDECDVTNIMTCSEQCATCGGTGYVECRFCGGTSFLTVGNKHFFGEGQRCPCCNDDGEVLCPDCKGNGWVANWRNDNMSNNKNLTSLGP
eukprot:CAMPEP_0185727092 /NCGR_PEP_ID=MMETSP1171-20130828/2882_1 /TAXON_ID=374046 /ORGANISM="Helicotheca tamensis, Strain CCMP826" /LENGTH=254 /DNA_ID=CAMNT_0028395589 /DNA_START=103 /DNA_END=867 /DNA_ORIENTATION=+